MRKNITKLVAAAIAAVTTTAFLAGCGSSAQSTSANAASKDNVKEEAADNTDAAKEEAADNADAAKEKKGTLTVSIGADWYPYLFIDDDDNLVGYDVDVVNAVAEKLGYDVEFEIAADMAGLFASLETGRSDLGTWQISATEERREKYVFSNVTYNTQNVYLCVAADSDITDISQLQDVHINADDATTIWGQFWANYAAEHPEQNLTLEKVNGTPYDEVNIEAVQNGTIAAFINTKVAINQVNEQYGDVYKLIGDPVISNPVYQVFRKGNEALRDEWDKALQELVDDGTLDELREKWNA